MKAASAAGFQKNKEFLKKFFVFLWPFFLSFSCILFLQVIRGRKAKQKLEWIILRKIGKEADG